MKLTFGVPTYRLRFVVTFRYSLLIADHLPPFTVFYHVTHTFLPTHRVTDLHPPLRLLRSRLRRLRYIFCVTTFLTPPTFYVDFALHSRCHTSTLRLRCLLLPELPRYTFPLCLFTTHVTLTFVTRCGLHVLSFLYRSHTARLSLVYTYVPVVDLLRVH